MKQKPAFQIRRLIRRKQRFVGLFLDFSKLFLEKKKIKQRIRKLFLDLSKLKQRFAKGIVLTLVANLRPVALQAYIVCLSVCFADLELGTQPAI